MEHELKALEISIIEELAVAYSRPSVAGLTSQRDADIRRLTTENLMMQTPEDIRDRLRAMLALSVEVMGERCEDHDWRSGIEGAILEGRMSILRALLDWMENGES